MSEDLSSRFPNLRPIRSAPSLSTVNGIGCTVYGSRDHDPETGTYVKTHWFTFFFIPVFALGAYRVANAPSGGWYFIGREPLSGAAKAWNLCLVCFLFAGAGLIWWNVHTGSAEYKARQKVEEADSLVEAGEVEKAASLYREVAGGTTEYAGPAATKFKALLKEPLDKAPARTVAAVLRVAASWRSRPDVLEGLAQRGLELAKTKGEDEPQDALAILDAIEPLHPKREDYLKVRRALLEKIVAKSPGDLEPVIQLALVYEAQGERDHCEKLLTPHAGRLKVTEGARMLGVILAHKGKTEEAYQLLRRYADEHLKHLHKAEEMYNETEKASAEAVWNEFQAGSARGFPYQEFERAPKAEKQVIYLRYRDQRLREDPSLQAADAARAKHRPVVPVAQDLSILHRSRARGLKDAARQAELEKAEEILKAVSGVSRPENKLELGRVYYSMGRQADGKKLFEGLLAATQRAPETLLRVSDALREVGDSAEARKLTEEAYEKETDPNKKRLVAVYRSLLPRDLEDEIAWLERADLNLPPVKAQLAFARGQLAQQRGKEEDAAEHLREAIRLHTTMPENAATLNNTGLACRALYGVTGETEQLDKAVSMFEKALALEPRDSIILTNVLTNVNDSVFRAIIGKTIDLTALHSGGQLGYLAFLYRDRKGKDDYTERVRNSPAVARLIAHANRLALLAPKQALSYETLTTLHLFTHDLGALRDLEHQLQEVDVDLENATRMQLDFYARKKDSKVKEQRKARAERWEKQYQRFQKEPRGVTFAVVAVTLADALIGREQIGEEVDADRVVRLTEEAHAAAPSRATHTNLATALLFRAHRQLVKQEPDYAKMAARARRSLDTGYLIAVALDRGGKLREAVLANKDVRRGCELLKDSTATFSDEISPWVCILLQATHPEEAVARIDTLHKSELEKVARAIGLRLFAASATTAFETYWALKLDGKEKEGEAVLKRCAAQGVPLPFDVP